MVSVWLEFHDDYVKTYIDIWEDAGAGHNHRDDICDAETKRDNHDESQHACKYSK